MDRLVVFYSYNGSNRYLANRIINELNCASIEIKPILNSRFFLLMGMGFGLGKVKTDLKKFDQIILVGPIWMGKFIYPLKKFVQKYKNSIRNLSFVTCCGRKKKKKDEKFGHGLVFNELKNLLPDKSVSCLALPILLVMPEELKEDGQAIMKTRLSDENFKGEILGKFNELIVSLKNPS